MSGRAARIGFLLLVVSAPRPAAAYEASVDASFAAQLYDVGSPFGPSLPRHRYTEMLSLKVYDIQGAHDPKRPELSAVARVRLDADLGEDPNERNPRSEDVFVPGLPTSPPLDIMMAYVEGRNYAGGLVGFRLGRQYVVDPLGWWSFDGALVRLTTPVYVAFETYGGFEQRGGLPLLATSRFESDGVFRGSRTGMPLDLWPSYLEESKLAPAYGFAVQSSGLTWLDTRLTYRKVINRDAVLVSPFPDETGAFTRLTGDRVSSERVGWAGSATAPSLGAAKGAFVYDLYSQRPSEYSASLDWYATPDLDVGADYEYFLPVFDGDSIWNWFSHLGTTTVQGRARWDATRRLSFAATGGVRRFATEGDPQRYAGSTDAAARRDATGLLDVLATADGRYRYPEGNAALRVVAEEGDRGKRRGGDVSTQRFFGQRLYDASVVLSLYQWEDALRPTRDATGFTYVLGGGYRPFPRTRVGVQWEHSMNDLVGHRFRALATLDLTVL